MSTPEIFSIEKPQDLPHEAEKYRIVLMNHQGTILKPYFTTEQGKAPLPSNPDLFVNAYKHTIRARGISSTRQAREVQFQNTETFNQFCLDMGFWFVFFEVYDHNLIKGK